MEVAGRRHNCIENLRRHDHRRAEGDQTSGVFPVRRTSIQEFAPVAGMDGFEAGIVTMENALQMRLLRIAGQEDDFIRHGEAYHGSRECDRFRELAN